MVATALDGFEELPPQLPPQSASSAQVLMLVQEDWLVAKDEVEEAVFKGWCGAQPIARPNCARAAMNVRIVAMDVITTYHREIKTSVQTRVPACSKASVHIRSLSLMRPLGTGGVTTEHRRAHLTTTRCHARVSCVPFVIEHPILHNCRDSSHILSRDD